MEQLTRFTVDILDKKNDCTLGEGVVIGFVNGMYEVQTPEGVISYDREDFQVDMFKNYEHIPDAVNKVLNKYDFENVEYSTLDKALEELKPLGWTFDYYLDAQPYFLRKIS